MDKVEFLKLIKIKGGDTLVVPHIDTVQKKRALASLGKILPRPMYIEEKCASSPYIMTSKEGLVNVNTLGISTRMRLETHIVRPMAEYPPLSDDALESAISQLAIIFYGDKISELNRKIYDTPRGDSVAELENCIKKFRDKIEAIEATIVYA